MSGEILILKEQQALLFSREVIEYIRNSLKNQDFRTGGYSLDDDFFGFKNGKYEMFFTNNEVVNPNNIGLVLPYLVYRIPSELLSDDNRPIELVLTNDAEIFKNKDVKTAKARRRWYSIENKKDKRVIYWHIRDDCLTKEDDSIGGTDAIEMMSFLALLHILRKAEFSQVWQYLVGIESIDFLILHKKEKFERWKNTEINVRLDFDETKPSAIDILIEDLKDRISKRKGREKPFLLIGNDFSWRLTIFSLFLNGENLNKLKERYKSDLSLLYELIKESPLGEKESLKDFIEKYFLLTFLNKNYKNDEELSQIYEEIFSPDNYRRLGYRRLLYGVRKPKNNDSDIKRSITGEPVDYWDPELFDQSLLEDETNYIKQLFERLISLNQPILSIPYLNGKLSPELAVKLIKAGLVDKDVIGFLGKVGFFISDPEHEGRIKRGRIILPSENIRKITGEKFTGRNPHLFKMNEKDSHYVDLFNVAPFTTTPAVTLQNESDLREIGNTALDSEQAYLCEAFEENNLPTRIIASFYVSDISRTRGYKSKGPIEDNINRPLSHREGAVAVCLTTLFEIEQIIKYKESNILSLG